MSPEEALKCLEADVLDQQMLRAPAVVIRFANSRVRLARGIVNLLNDQCCTAFSKARADAVALLVEEATREEQ